MENAGYHLGVDLGTTFTAAATWQNGRVDMVDLGNRAVTMPSVVYLDTDNSYLVGEAAERKGQTDPQRMGREFKRRLGDSTPIVLGGVPCSADLLMGRLLAHVVKVATENHEGVAPTSITLTHPASWGPYKLDLLSQAARLADAGAVELVPEPVAAVMHYATSERVEPGAIVAVYDFGGGTFDAAVVTKTDGGAHLLGESTGIETLGGVDFDQELLRLVYSRLGPEAQEGNPDDPMVAAALTRLREECRDAKEGLAMVDEVTVPVLLPAVQASVDVNRADLAQIVGDDLTHTVSSLQDALRSAGVENNQLHSVLLAGGSSRIPGVAELVGEAIGRPVAVDAHPKFIVAMGAALLGAQRSGAATAAVGPETGAAPAATLMHDAVTEPVPVVPVAPAPSQTSPSTEPTVPVSQVPLSATPPALGQQPPGLPPQPLGGPAPVQQEPRRRFPWVLAIVGVLLFAAVVAGVVFFGGGGDDDQPQGEEAGAGAGGEDTDQPTPETGDDLDDDDDNAEPAAQPTEEPPEEPTEEPEPTEGAEERFDAVLGQPISVGAEPDTPVLAGGALWIPNAGADTVTRLDADTGETTDITVGARPDTPIEAFGAIWVPVRDAGVLARIDPATLGVTSVEIGERADTPIAAADHIWVTTRADNELLIIQPDTLEIVQRSTMGGRTLTPVLAGDALWFVTRDDNELHVIDLTTFDPAQPVNIDVIPVGTDPDRPVVENDRLFVPIRGEARVQVFDTASRLSVGSVDVGQTPDTPVAANGRVFVPGVDDNVVTVIDAETLEVVATVDVGNGPKTGVAAAGSVWIPVSEASLVVQISVDSTERVDAFVVGNDPETPATDGEVVWIPSAGADTVTELRVAPAQN